MKSNLLLIAAIAAFCVFPSGCVVHPPSVEIAPPIQVVPPDYDDGKGCPPGLRKQGRC